MLTFVLLGYWFGQLPFVQKYFNWWCTIIVISVLPAAYEVLRHWYAKKREPVVEEREPTAAG